VDQAESEEERAFSVNRDGAAVVAKAASQANVPLIHLSTDYGRYLETVTQEVRHQY